ncbi:MAG: ATP-binding cassette domain-containing protein [Blautia sp.]
MGLLGANVAGKTTLMRMIADIMEPSNGSISFNGEGIRKMGADYRNIFGFLPQDFGYSRDFTVKDYLEYVAALKDVAPRETTKKINHLLDILTLSEVKGKNLADHSEVEGSIPAEPRLEDLYLWLFPQEVHG